MPVFGGGITVSQKRVFYFGALFDFVILTWIQGLLKIGQLLYHII